MEATTRTPRRHRIDSILRIWNYTGRSTKFSPLGKKPWKQVIMPKSLRREFLQLVHDTPISGHFGRDRTLERVRLTAYWPSVVVDGSNYCLGCPKYQLQKRPKHAPRAPIANLRYPLKAIIEDFLRPRGSKPRNTGRVHICLTNSGYSITLRTVCPYKRCYSHDSSKGISCFRIGLVYLIFPYPYSLITALMHHGED